MAEHVLGACRAPRAQIGYTVARCVLRVEVRRSLRGA